MSLFQLRNLSISWRLGLILLVSLAMLLVLATLMLVNSYRNLHDGKVEQLTWVVETAAGVLKEAHQRELSGELTREQAQQQALATLSALRYAGEEYFFVTDLAGRMLVHADAKLIGQDVSGLKDTNGVAFVSEMTRTAREQGSGTVAYLWPKRPGTEPVDKVTYVSRFDPWGWMLATGVYIDDIKEQFRRELVNLTLLGVFMLGLMAAVILLIARSISKPMEATVAAMADIAGGEADLTRQLSTAGRDELSTLAGHFNTFTAKLREVIGETQQTALALSGTARELGEQAGETQARGERQSQQVEQVATAINEVAYSVQDVARNAEHTATEVRNAEERAEQGLRGIDEALVQVEQLSATVTQAVRVVSGLAEESNRIGGVLEVIQTVAEQTNLLALNAAIEAARAGEQGRGFAVVADEVRLLAQRTQQSTAEIRTMIEQLQTHSTAAVRAIDESNRVTRLTIEQAGEAGASLRQIVDSLRSITALAASIASATLEQSHVVDEINGNVAQTAELAHENARNAERAAEASQSLSRMAARLDQLLGRFRV
jgi:methyl-accepting chemotaxis protein